MWHGSDALSFHNTRKWSHPLWPIFNRGAGLPKTKNKVWVNCSSAGCIMCMNTIQQEHSSSHYSLFSSVKCPVSRFRIRRKCAFSIVCRYCSSLPASANIQLFPNIVKIIANFNNPLPSTSTFTNLSMRHFLHHEAVAMFLVTPPP